MESAETVNWNKRIRDLISERILQLLSDNSAKIAKQMFSKQVK